MEGGRQELGSQLGGTRGQEPSLTSMQSYLQAGAGDFLLTLSGLGRSLDASQAVPMAGGQLA